MMDDCGVVSSLLLETRNPCDEDDAVFLIDCFEFCPIPLTE